MGNLKQRGDYTMLKDKVVREATQFLYNLNTVRYELERNKYFKKILMRKSDCIWVIY